MARNSNSHDAPNHLKNNKKENITRPNHHMMDNYHMFSRQQAKEQREVCEVDCDSEKTALPWCILFNKLQLLCICTDVM